jgi:hypothetical protein
MMTFPRSVELALAQDPLELRRERLRRACMEGMAGLKVILTGLDAMDRSPPPSPPPLAFGERGLVFISPNQA